GIEAVFYAGNYTVDVGDNYATLTVNGNFCGMTCKGFPGFLIISGIDFAPAAAITSVSLTDGGLGAFNPSFTANSVTFQVTAQPEPAAESAMIIFSTDAVTSVRERGPFAILGTGLFGLAARRRRTKS